MSFAARALFGWASPGGERARLSILIFHRVHAVPDPLFPGEVDAGYFDGLCGWLARCFNVLPLDRAVQQLRAGSLPPRALAITFDDGYADNRDVAFPILRKHGLTATFFVSTSFLNGGCMWNDRVIESIRHTEHPELDLSAAGLGCVKLGGLEQQRAAIAAILQSIKHLDPTSRRDAVDLIVERAAVTVRTDLMMSTDQVRELHVGGMQIGAHTLNHPILAKLHADEALEEIDGSRRVLEAILGDAVTLFAYPNGRPVSDYTAETVRLVARCGFEAAVTTAWGAADRATSTLEIPRFTPWDRSRFRFALRLASQARERPAALASPAFLKGQRSASA